MNTTFVTGATGFVGSRLVRRLVEDGHRVRALVRPGSDRRNLAGVDVEVVEGDLAEPASFSGALRGCDTLFHCAADYRLFVPRPEIMYRVNVEGTRALMCEAVSAGVGRVVYTSSVATLGSSVEDTPVDETSPARLDDMVGHYKRSKFLAEEEVTRLVRTEGLPAVIVCPSTPVGPGDIKPTPTGRVVVDAASGRMPAFVDTGLNLVHADDVALGHLLALEKGRIGERYILGSENLTLREILGLISEITGVKAPRVRLPHGLVLPLAYVSEAIAGVAGGEPRVTVDGVRMSRKTMFYTSRKARRELGYEPSPARKALEDAVRWFAAGGYLDAPRKGRRA